MRAKLATFGRRLLVVFPTHAGLVGAFTRLRDRGFVPPPSQAWPTGDAARVFARWTADDRQARAQELVALPDPTTADGRALGWTVLELLLRVPGEEARAEELAARLEKRSGPEDGARLALARFRLSRGDWGQRLAPLRAHAASGALAEGLRMAASHAVASAPKAHGVTWLVPVCEGTAVANVALARLRRPALVNELEKIFDWLNQAGPAAWMAEAEAADASGDFARGTELIERALATHGFPGDLERVLAARRDLLVEDVPRPWRFPLPFPEAPAPARGEWSKQLARDPSPELLEALGDRQRAAERWLARGEVAHALRHRDVIGDERLASALAEQARTMGARADDEQRITSEADTRTFALARYALASPGLDKEAQALRLAAAGLVLQPPAPAVDTVPSDDPHHPENRLAAASDLVAAGQLSAAATVLAALLRKADSEAPARLGVVVAQALEADEPPEELVVAATKALPKVPLLMGALRDNPFASYALHEPLLARAQDTSLADADRLAALETWLGIWRATDTPPDAASLASFRRDEPELLVVAAARLARVPSPTETMERFLAAHPPSMTTPEAFSEALHKIS